MLPPPAEQGTPDESARGRVSPFGERNRRLLIARYFAEHDLVPSRAWASVYGLLLWVDPTTGLAHCYESDKCQPGKPWYARSLAFHRWLASSFSLDSLHLKDALDWLFRRALEAYLQEVAGTQERRRERGAGQREAFVGEVFPMPGSDPELEKILIETLEPYLTSTPPPAVLQLVGDRLREYWKQENKRKNLLGEGFEDVLAAVVEAAVPDLAVRTRTSVADIGGFYAPGLRDKATKVDLVVEREGWARPTLVNVKWSIRADREDQLWDDFNEYVRFDRDGRGFDHYLISNEFDPARLNAACDRRQANSHVFKRVVHISTDGLMAAHGCAAVGKMDGLERDSSFKRVLQQVKSGRLISLATWLEMLARAQSD